MIIRNQQRLVEFYDSRACVEAYDNTYNTEYMGGRWDVAFFWDHPYRDRNNTNQRREKNHERERDEPRGNNRRRSDTVRPPRDYDHYNGGGHSGGRKDDRYASAAAANPPLPPHTPAASARMHQNVDPRLQYNPQMPHQLPAGGAPMSNLSASNATMPDGQRLEQAQKAQQILSMLAQQPQQQQIPPPPQAASLTSPFQPTNLQSPPPPTAFVAPVPPTEDQASQVQQLLGLLVSCSLFGSAWMCTVLSMMADYRVKLLSNNINSNSNSSIIISSKLYLLNHPFTLLSQAVLHLFQAWIQPQLYLN